MRYYRRRSFSNSKKLSKLKALYFLIAFGIVILVWFINAIGLDIFLIFVGCCLVFGSLGYALWRFLLAKPQESEPKDSYQKKEFKFIPGTYKPAPLLTERELSFYRRLRPIADRMNLVILTKVRMADLVVPNADKKYYDTLFRRISQKHVDFVLCNPENLSVRLLIELDDSTHFECNERDTFVEDVYNSTGYRMLRTFGNITLDQVNYALACDPGSLVKITKPPRVHILEDDSPDN